MRNEETKFINKDFFEFYDVVATHLKERFPHLKIGGPAIAWNIEWGAEFAAEMKKRNLICQE